MHTPSGRKRGTNLNSNATIIRPRLDETVHLSSHLEIKGDDIERLDHQTVEKVKKIEHCLKPTDVAIRRGEHARSQFVVSLKGMTLSSTRPKTDERLPVSLVLDTHKHEVSSAAYENYATLGADLKSGMDPRTINEQFTPSDFDQAYSQIYGRLDKMRHVFKVCALTLTEWFYRAKAIEEQTVENVEETLASVEVERFSLARALVAFGALALIVTLPANAIVLYRTASTQKQAATETGKRALEEVMSAAKAENLPASVEQLKKASNGFRAADAIISDTNSLALAVASVMPDSYRSSRALMEIGDKTSEAARFLAIGLDKVFSDPGRRLDERLEVLGAYSRAALLLLSDASKAARTVEIASVPANYQEKAKALISRLEDSQEVVREFTAFSEILADMTGQESQRRYLLIFQNNTELRPTGGFMGSLAQITFDKGAVKSISVPGGGTYDLQGQLLVRVTPPKPLQLVNTRWQFHDSNWSPDFPESAKKIRWFWSKSGQATVDGIIAINASFVEKLLDITGPLDMSEYGKTIDSSNFLIETQKAVELEYDKTANTPKKFVGDMATRLLERVKTLKKDEWFKIARLVSEALATKDVQLALTDTEEEKFAEKYGWNGRLKNTVGDFLAVIEANIAGQKTDGVIAEKVVQDVIIGKDGKITDTLTLNRTHQGKKGELFRGVRNVSYLRVYVPKGSRLINASGFNAPEAKFFKTPDEDSLADPDIFDVESGAADTQYGINISQEGSYTVFGGWLQLDPGASQKIIISYELPMSTSEILAKLDAAPEQNTGESPRGAYFMLLTSQAGKPGREILVNVHQPKSWNLAWVRPTALQANGSLTYANVWDRDQAIGALFSSK